ncbi:DUF4406 domain-containing protein [Mucilaginibacter sp.]|uniref:DUF4406 domain-containing protein n=1 Tax=Mucilaginibacter sp. TaxID=1882438 RepID=UPI003264A88F
MKQEVSKIAAKVAENTEDKVMVYIAGKVTGLKYDEVYAKFKKKQIELEELGFFVLNPCDLVASDCKWQLAMKISVIALACARYVCLLPDWHDSDGATVERALAMKLGLGVIQD